jgi:O-methyltransferase
MKKLVSKLLGLAGLELHRKIKQPIHIPGSELKDQPAWIRDIISAVSPFTMTSPERLASLCQGIAYIVSNNIPGDIVECGVWRGGSTMAAALALKHFSETDRSLFLFDTFEGMPQPTDADVVTSTGQTADSIFKASNGEWCLAREDEVRRNILSTDYPTDRIFLIKGMVENTIPEHSPDQIALLRLDTDWYESTKHELRNLYPVLSPRGVLIIDDYGHWDGARRAVDEYIKEERLPLLLSRVDYTGRMTVKPV